MSCGSWIDVEDQALYRYNAYELLRRVFLWEFPLELFIEITRPRDVEKRSTAVEGSSEGAFKECLVLSADADLQAAYRDVHIEYTRLFVGPHHLPAPPYESVYRSPDRLLMQDETISVRVAYAKSGFRVASCYPVPDDNVGIELEFMCALSMATHDAVGVRDCAKSLVLIARQQEFCNDHSARWIPQFCADIETNSSSKFWQGVAAFTREFIQDESTALIGMRRYLEGVTGFSQSAKSANSCVEPEMRPL